MEAACQEQTRILLQTCLRVRRSASSRSRLELPVVGRGLQSCALAGMAVPVPIPVSAVGAGVGDDDPERSRLAAVERPLELTEHRSAENVQSRDEDQRVDLGSSVSASPIPSSGAESIRTRSARSGELGQHVLDRCRVDELAGVGRKRPRREQAERSRRSPEPFARLRGGSPGTLGLPPRRGRPGRALRPGRFRRAQRPSDLAGRRAGKNVRRYGWRKSRSTRITCRPAAGRGDREIGDRGRLALALDRARDHDRLRRVLEVDQVELRPEDAERLGVDASPARRASPAGRRCEASAAAAESARAPAGPAAAQCRRRFGHACRAPRAGRRARARAAARARGRGRRSGPGGAASSSRRAAALRSDAFEVWSASIVASCCSLSTRLA